MTSRQTVVFLSRENQAQLGTTYPSPSLPVRNRHDLGHGSGRVVGYSEAVQKPACGKLGHIDRIGNPEVIRSPATARSVPRSRLMATFLGERRCSGRMACKPEVILHRCSSFRHWAPLAGGRPRSTAPIARPPYRKVGLELIGSALESAAGEALARDHPKTIPPAVNSRRVCLT